MLLQHIFFFKKKKKKKIFFVWFWFTEVLCEGLRLNRTAPVAARGVFVSLVPELTIVSSGQEGGDWISKGNVPAGYWTSLQFVADFISGLEQVPTKEEKKKKHK